MNRAGAHDRFAQVSAQDRFNKVALLCLDLDRFKLINEMFGFVFGDLLLQSIAERLKRFIFEGDLLARVGDDEFMMILTRVSHVEEALKLAHKVREVLSGPFTLRDHEIMMIDFRITASIGIALAAPNEEESEILLKNATTAMMRAKKEGGDRSQIYTPEVDAAALERLTLESGLREVLRRNELFLEYQPQLELKTGKMIGVEALVRWNHPDLGVIPPGRFISVAEEIGMIEPIGEWVLQTACAQNKAWQRSGLPPVRVAVNLSSCQLQRKSLINLVARVLKETELDPVYLEFEITESTTMQNIETTVETLSALKRMGIQISMDDFGTGYSSLTYLRRFPIDVLKMDRSFLVENAGREDGMAIMIAMMKLAGTLRLKIVAEGVETEDQLEFLRLHGCDAIQGFLFSPSLAPNEIAKLLKKSSLGFGRWQQASSERGGNRICWSS